jgi:hypothetical protein
MDHEDFATMGRHGGNRPPYHRVIGGTWTEPKLPDGQALGEAPCGSHVVGVSMGNDQDIDAANSQARQGWK